MQKEDTYTLEILEKLDNLEKLIKETAFFANLAKNGSTVPLGDNQVLTRIFTGQLLYVDSRDISLAPHLIMTGEWEMEITQLFRSLVKPDSVVFDVGANVGYFGMVAGTDIKDGSIHFFEANPHLIPLIAKSVSVNGLEGISKINNYAVSDKDGELMELKFVKDYWGSSTLHGENLQVEIEEKIGVRSISLDNYCKDQNIQKVDLVKMDVEAHEESVFKGMQNIIKANPQLKLFLEYTIDAYSNKFFDSLKASFENIYVVVDSNLIPVNSEDDLRKLAVDWVMLFLFNN